MPRQSECRNLCLPWLSAPQTLFLAEHNEHEPDLVVVKPVTADPAVSNLLIATKSGLVVSLRLLSDGSSSGSAKPIDFVLIYQRRWEFSDRRNG